MPSILLVEGSDMIRRSMETLLDKEGYDIVSAGSGAEAIHCLSLFNYDIVITDMVMPQITGLDLVKHIKADESKSNVGTIIVSSLRDERSKLESLYAGVDEYLSKPIMPFDLLLRIKKLLKERSTEEE